MLFDSYMFVLTLVFLVVVIPTIFHYVTRWKQMKAPSPGDGRMVVDKAALAEVRESADRLEDRIRTLEKLLDAEAPGWREK